jgi:hypothetical protein
MLIQQNFDEILSNDEGSKFLLNLPIDAFTSICDSNGLNITDEMILINMFEKYLDHRKELPLLKEEDPSLDWSILNEEERKKRDDDKDIADKLLNEEKEKAKKEKEDDYNKLEEHEKFNADWDLKVEDIHK